MGEDAGTYELKGSAPVAEWRKRIEALRATIHARDAEIAKQRSAVKKKRNIAIGVAALAGVIICIATKSAGGIPVILIGAIAAAFLFKAPPADFIGEERVTFVRELVALLADIAPNGALRLAAQLDARLGVPPAELPKGSDDAVVSREKKEAWLSGSIAAIPGLRLGWQVTEWRTVKLARRTVRRRKTKIKTKAKFSLATRLAVRLDVDRSLFALKPIANPQRAQDGESSVEVRERPGGWSLRGRRDLKHKTPLWSADVAGGLATLREQGKAEFFGQPAASLINLMKLCEGRLLPSTLPSTLPGTLPAPARGSAP
jgi:hypothetical protein